VGERAVRVSVLNRFAGQPAVRPILLILALYIPVALVYGLVTPIYEGPDEIGHVLYAKHIAEGRGIPVQSREYAIGYGFGQEGSQAPLYYALNAALVRVLGLPLDDLKGLPPSNPFSTCGRPARYNVARYRHDPRREEFPYQGAARAVHVMRLFSAALGGVTVVAVYAAARLAFPQPKEAAPLAAALVAFNPQFVFMGGVVNNDNLVNCLTVVAVALTVYFMQRGFTWWRALILGLLCGLAPLAKLGGVMALAFAGMGLLADCVKRVSCSVFRVPCSAVGGRRSAARVSCSVFRGRRSAVGGRRSVLRHCSLLIARSSFLIFSFLSVAGWWFVRNWMLYGDPTGTNMMLSIYGGRRGWPWRLVLPEIFATFRSYWAAFACGLGFPQPVYWLFGVLVALGLAGWVRAWRTTPRRERWMAGLFLLWLGLVVVSWVRWNQITYAPLGRLFFQANAAIGALLGYGLARLTWRPRWVLGSVGGGLWVLAVIGALAVVRPAFALPPREPVPAVPVSGQPAPEVLFGDAIADEYIRVWGHTLSTRSVEPGQGLTVALFVQARQPITEDYALALQWVSPVAGDDTTLVNLNTIPGGGNYPTYAWQPDEVIADRYRLVAPERVERMQAWRVVAIFYRLSDGKRLPVTVAGQPGGEMLELGLVRVGASHPVEVLEDARLQDGPSFGDAMRLEGVQLISEGSRIRIHTWWRALAPLEKDYTVLVHLYDAEGALLAASDAPPLRGGFPTSLWKPGDLIADEFVVSSRMSTSDAKGESIGLGWYDPITGARLPALETGNRLTDDVYRILLDP